MVYEKGESYPSRAPLEGVYPGRSAQSLQSPHPGSFPIVLAAITRIRSGPAVGISRESNTKVQCRPSVLKKRQRDFVRAVRSVGEDQTFAPLPGIARGCAGQALSARPARAQS